MLKVIIVLFSLFLVLFLRSRVAWYVLSICFIIARLLFSGLVYSPLGHYKLFSLYYMLDGLRSPLVYLTIWISALMIIARQGIKVSKNREVKFMFFITFLCVVLVICFGVSRFMNFYLLFEASLIPTFFIILGWGYQPERLQAGLYLMIYTVTASLPFLLNLMIFYYVRGSSRIIRLVSKVCVPEGVVRL